MCTNIDQCVDKGCVMRHPKPCKYFARKMCKFENCAYSHKKDVSDAKIQHLEDQVANLKCEVENLTEAKKEAHIEAKKFLQQVADISNNLRGVIKQIKHDRKQHVNNKEKIEDIENKVTEVFEEMPVIHTDTSKKIEETKEKEKVKEVIVDKVDLNRKRLKGPMEKFRCKKFDCSFKKEITLTKHINTKHNNKLNNIQQLGEGQFGFVFEVRPGKEKEAEELRFEWKHKEKTEITTKENIDNKSHEEKEQNPNSENKKYEEEWK